MGSSPTLSVRMLGEFQIHWGETPLAGALTPRLQSLFAYLLLHRDTALSRQQLAFQFWPESSDGQARTNLRKALYRLRQALPALEAFVDLEGATLRWQPDARIWLDVAAFEEKLYEAETAGMQEQPALLAAAVALYRGSLLPDLYDDWVLPLREQLRQRYLDALELLAEQQEAKREYAAASQTARQMLREEPLRERGYRRLMRLQALSGDVAAALHTYHQCATLLERELSVEPAPATQAAHRQLLRQQARPQEERAVEAPRQLPLVGRNRAWRQLLAAWRSVTAGRSQVVLISGEAGIGKTRLVEELLNWAGRQGVVTLRAACFSMEEQLPLAPVGEWLRAEAVQQALPSLDRRWRREAARVLPELLATEPDLEMPRPMTEAWQQQHLFMALVETVAAAGSRLLLFLDDLHWSDAATLTWLHFLARQKKGWQFLLLGTVRAEEVVTDHPLLAWQRELERMVPLERISLSRLDQAATAELAAHLLREQLDAEAVEALYQVTEGNPLFTVEMARAGLRGQAGKLPHKIRSVIEVRLEHLTPPARELAGLAAIIGRSFSFPLLAAASPVSEAEVVGSLDELWQRQIVREQTAAGEETYDFSHDQIRQVALAQLSAARRCWGHRRVAEALAKVFAGGLDPVYGTIAAHWEAAGDNERAVESYVRAAEAASLLYAHEESVRHLQRALGLLPAEDARCAAIYGQLGEGLVVLSRHEEAVLAFKQAEAGSGDVLEKARLISRRVAALNGRYLFAEAKSAYREGMALLEAIPSHTWATAAWRIWLELQFGLLDALYFEHSVEEMPAVLETIAGPLDAHGTARQRSEYYHFQAKREFLVSRIRITAEVVHLMEESLRWARLSGDEALIALQTFGLGFALLWGSRAAEAVDCLRAAAEEYEQLGILPMRSRTLTYLGFGYQLLGNEGRVRQLLEESAEVIRADGNAHYIGVVEGQRAWLAYRAGEAAAAAAHGQAALTLWEPLDETVYPIQWVARLPLLAAALESGEVAAAREQAVILLDRRLQRLPDPLVEALQAAVAAASEPDAAALARVCRVAREHNYL
jgi:DNA-binding SARP family transcriptional activator